MPNSHMGNLGEQKPTIINNRHGKAIGVRRVREKHNNCFSINLNVNSIKKKEITTCVWTLSLHNCKDSKGNRHSILFYGFFPFLFASGELLFFLVDFNLRKQYHWTTNFFFFFKLNIHFSQISKSQNIHLQKLANMLNN